MARDCHIEAIKKESPKNKKKKKKSQPTEKHHLQSYKEDVLYWPEIFRTELEIKHIK